MDCDTCGRPRPDDGSPCPACGAPSAADAADLDEATHAIDRTAPAPTTTTGVGTADPGAITDAAEGTDPTVVDGPPASAISHAPPDPVTSIPPPTLALPPAPTARGRRAAASTPPASAAGPASFPAPATPGPVPSPSVPVVTAVPAGLTPPAPPAAPVAPLAPAAPLAHLAPTGPSLPSAPTATVFTGGEGPPPASPLPAAAMYLGGVVVTGSVLYVAALALAGNLNGFSPRTDLGSSAVLLAPVLVVAVAALLGRFTLGPAVAPADRTGVAIGAGIGPASLLLGWTIAAALSMRSYGLDVRQLGWRMMEGFGSSGLIIPVVVAILIGTGLGLLQTSARRPAWKALGVGALCAVVAVVPVALYDQVVRWSPIVPFANWRSLLYLLVAYIAPAATSGLITLASYRMAAPRVGGAPGTVPMGAGAAPGYPAGSMVGYAGSLPPATPAGTPMTYGPAGYGPSPTNGLAIASLVCSLLSLFCGVGAILGVIFGAVALRQIKASGGSQRGRGMAIAGLVIGTILLVIGVLYLVLVVAVTSSGNSY